MKNQLVLNRFRRSPRHGTIEPLEARIAPAANNWIGAASGNWNTASNWSDGVPTADDVVTINPAGTLTITIDSGAQVAASISMPGDDVLSIVGGSLTLTATSTIHSLGLGGSGSLFANAAVSLTGTGSFSGSANLAGSSAVMVPSGATFGITGGEPNLQTEVVNAGTILEGTAFLDLDGAAGKLRIVSGGVFETTTGNGFQLRASNNPLGVFIEAGGVFRHTSNGGVFTVGAGVPFHVEGGTVEEAGTSGATLFLGGAGDFQNALFKASAGASIQFQGSSNTIVGGVTGSGAGALILSGTAELHADAAGAVLNFPAGFFNQGGEGTLSGPGVFTNTGTIQLTDGAPNLRTELVDAGTIVQGTAHLDLDAAAGKLRIVSGGVFETTTGNGFQLRAFNNPLGVFIEAGGVFRHTSNGGSFTVAGGVPFHVQGGTVEEAGSNGAVLYLGGVGDFQNAIFKAAAGVSIQFQGSGNTIVGGVTGSGAGSLYLGGTAELHADAAGAVLNFPAGFFNLGSSGTLSGPGVFTNTGTIQLTDGEPNLRTELVDAGTILEGTAYLDLDAAAGKLRVVSGGVFETTTGNGFQLRASNNPLGVFIEAGGVFRHTSNGGVFTVGAGVPFHVEGGTVEEAGSSGAVLSLGGTGDFHNAVFKASAGASIQFQGSSNTIVGGVSGSGAGAVNLSGSAELHADAAGAVLNFPAGFFNLGSSGTLSGPGVFTNTGKIQLTDGEPNLRTELVNAGTIVEGTAYLDLDAAAGKLRIVSGGVFETTTGNGFQLRAFNNPLGVFIEAGGVFRHTSNGGSFTVGAGVPFSNLGTVAEAGTNGATLFINGNIAQKGTSNLSAGTWEVANGTTLNLGNTFSLATNAANIIVRGTGNFTGLGALATNSGTLALLEGADLTTNAPAFTNSGALTLSVGTVLTLSGSFTQTAAGSTTFQIGGLAAAQLGRIAAAGAATLAGTANFQIANGFAPTAGQVLTLATYASKTGDFTNVTGLGLGRAAIFEAAATPSALTLSSLVDAADLAAQSISTPVNTSVGADIALSYTVKNLAPNATLASTWVDTIYLSKDGTLDAGDIVLTRVTHTGALAAGASYTENVSVPLVGAFDGNYQVLVLADAQGRVADPDRVNNLAASGGTFALTMPTLTAGTPFNGTIKSGQDVYFKVALPAGQTPSFTLSGAVAGEAEIYESFAAVPTRAMSDASAFTLGSTVQRILADASAPGTYYVLLHGREAAGAGQNFTFTVSGLGFDIVGLDLNHGANLGKVTTTLLGSQFTPGTTVTLVSGGTTRAATAIYFTDANTVSATFDLSGLAAGNYDVVANNGVASDSLPGAFAVANGGTAGKLKLDIGSPRYIRPPFAGTAVTITYQNTGETDIDAPLLNLFAENARLRLADQSDFVGGNYSVVDGKLLSVYELLGVSGGLAGVLSPGEIGTIDVIFEPIDSGAHVYSNFNVLVAANDSAAVNFDSIKAEIKPVGVADDAWNAVFANFKAAAGNTIGSYKAMLVDDANYLGQFGKVSPSVTKLIDFELDQAGQLDAIVDRYELGAFGRGSSAMPFGGRLFTDTNGNVTLKDGGTDRTFAKLADGVYRGTSVDFGTLTKSATGAFTIGESDGSKTVFRAADGRIDFLETANGNKMTAAWNTNGQLTKLTNSVTGDTTSYTYNAKGRIATDIDPVGRVTTYTYDASGEHLLSTTNAAGTSTFTYVTGQGAAREHAVATATGPDGVTTTFTYDALGRLTQRTIGSGADALTVSFSYDSAGKVTATDAAGHATSTYYIAQGAIARTIDPLGQVTAMSYDAQGRFSGLTDPSGVKTSVGLDANGLISTVGDAGKAKTQMQFGGAIRSLLSVTDPGGDTTKMTYDTKGNLTETLNPDGSAIHYEYDTKGRVSAFVDANGGRTSVTYDGNGLLTQRTLPDGEIVTYTYDGHRNLLTATDGEGTTTMTYDAADRVLTTTYPNGKTITSTYDSAGRRTTVADQTGYTVRYSYDALGRLDTVKDTVGNLLVDYDYNTLGQLSTETRGNDAKTSYAYDAAGHITSVTHRDGPGAVTGFFNYTYDTHDRIKTVTDASGTATYTYDVDGQLIGAALPGGRTLAYGYDVEGNRVTVSDSASGTVNYTTNNADQYTTAGAQMLTYDRAGHVIASIEGGVTISYRYDAEGHLAGITSPGSVIAFDYDALGNRIGKIENGVRTDYASDPAGLGFLFGEYSGATATAHYATGLAVEARIDGAGTSSFYHYDAKGNTALLSGAGGASVASYTYLPFGKIASQTGASAQPFTYNGASGVTDEAGDLYAMRARTYDAALGRFTSRDPIGFGGGDTNIYRYANNDPVNLSDPTGLEPYDYYGANGVGYYNSFGNAPAATGELARGVIRVTGEGIPVYGDIASPITRDFAEANAFRAGLSAAPGVNLPAISPLDPVYQAEQLAQTTIAKSAPQVLSKGAQVLEFLQPVAKVVAPVAKFLASRPVQVVFAVKQTYDITKSAHDYYKDAGEYGKFNPDEAHFSPKYSQDNGDNFLLSQLIKDGIAAGKSKRDATLDAINFLKKNGIYDPLANPNPHSPSEVIRPNDPNNLVGPAGAGADPVPDIIAPGQLRFDGFVSGGGTLPFKIEFENKPTASAPAQVVHVTQTLDADLNFATFAFTGFGFGKNEITAGGTSFHTIYDATATLGVKVKIDADLNTQTGVLDVTYTSLDPQTNEVPANPFAGFLPTEDGTGRGDGFLTYSVKAKAASANGTTFTSLATIVFDTEAALDTPTVTNKIDSSAPTSTVTALPATTSRPTFVVKWTAADDVGGSGIGGITLSYSDNGGALQTATVANADGGFRFDGVVGHTYAFYSQAADKVGNLSALPASPEQTITVVPPTFVNVGRAKTFLDADGDRYTITYAGPGTAKVALLDPDGDGRGAIDILQVDGSTVASSLSITVKKVTGGDGRVNIGDVKVNGSLNAFAARSSDFVVNGLTASGSVAGIAIGQVLRPDALLADPMIKIGGAASSSLNVSAVSFADGFKIQTPGKIGALTARSFGDGDISARAIGTLTATLGGVAADVTSLIGIGSIAVKGGSLSGHITARSIGPVSVTGGGFSGEITSLTTAAALGVTPALTSLAISGGDFTGDMRVLGNAGAISILALGVAGGNMTGASINAARIASLVVGKNLATSTVLAGADLGADHALGGTGLDGDTFARGVIGSAFIAGTVNASVIGAGVNPTDAIFHNGNDTIVASTASRIAALTIRGTASADSYFAAGLYAPLVKIANVRINTATDPRFLHS